jgi:histidinol-phosphatase (PHP family)
VLTDYHVHLRQDEIAETPASRFFTPGNAERYREAAADRGIAELGVSEHVYRFTQALDVWDHEFWRHCALDDLDEYCGFVREETDLRLGIEADFVPGREDRMAELLAARDWDYVVGSVHFLGEAAVDYDKYDVWTTGESPDRVWRKYFEWLGEAAMSGLFDILAHPDLVKHWGRERPWPERDPRYYYEIAMEGIAESGIAVEVSTAGLRKPVGEIYPARAFLEMVVDAGNPIALSSDAHVPDQLGYGYDQALELLDGLGVGELSVFERRERRLEPIGAT